MCWFTLTPAKSKHNRHHSSDSSCVEELVRVNPSPTGRRFTQVKVKVPTNLSMDFAADHRHHHHHPHLHHHHRHHLHPLHLHPIHGHHLHHHHHDRVVRLHGSGKRRCSSPPGPPPPTRDHSRVRPRHPSPSPARPKEPIYRTQIVEPVEIRENTRTALRGVQPERQRGRLRRVAGYEVLGTQVPFDWDCISSTVGSSNAWVRKRAKTSTLQYPPFGSIERWL